MEIIRNLENYKASAPVAVAVGAFDALHIGHKKVLEAVREQGLAASVFTFAENPAGEKAAISTRDKLEILEELGIEKVFMPEFEQLKNMEAEHFIRKLLIEKIGAAKICCGEDFKFGRGAEGNTELLVEICRETGTDAKITPFVEDERARVSTTRIRQAVAQGDMRTAQRLLGRFFGFRAEVIYGNRIGATLGTPTINQRIPRELVLPKFGVYASYVSLDKEKRYAVSNVGVKPTVGSAEPLCETWIPGYSGNLYGMDIRVELVGFIREERKFASLEELKKEILKNAETAQRVVGTCSQHHH